MSRDLDPYEASADARTVANAIDRAADVGRDMVAAAQEIRDAILAHKPHRSAPTPLSTWPGFAKNVPRCVECLHAVETRPPGELLMCKGQEPDRSKRELCVLVPRDFSCGLWRHHLGRERGTAGDPPGTFNGYTDH